MQHKILQTHKLNSNDFNRVNNTIFAYVIPWLILKYHMVFKGGIYSVLVWKKKKFFWEELLVHLHVSLSMISFLSQPSWHLPGQS